MEDVHRLVECRKPPHPPSISALKGRKIIGVIIVNDVYFGDQWLGTELAAIESNGKVWISRPCPDQELENIVS